MFNLCSYVLLTIVARIKQSTGVSVHIPPDNSKDDIIRIEGTPEGVAKAKTELIEMVDKMVNFLIYLLLRELWPQCDHTVT